MSRLRATRFGGAAGSEILISATAFALTMLLVLEGVTVHWLAS